MTDPTPLPEPDSADVELAIRAAAHARYLSRWPGAPERASRYAAEMVGDPMYRVEMSAALAALAAAGRLPAAPVMDLEYDEEPEIELPGMWERADYTGGLDEVRGPSD